MQKFKISVICAWMLVLSISCQKLDNPSSSSPKGTTYILPASSGTTNNNETNTNMVPETLVTRGVNSIVDPLTTGRSVGKATGGRFSPGGFTVTTHNDGYLAYSTSIYRNILVEFDATGYMANEDDGGDGKIVMVEIFDSPHDFAWNGHDPWNSQYNMFHLRKRGLSQGQHHHRVDGLELKFGGRSNTRDYKTWEGDSPSGHQLAWHPHTTYHWVVKIQNGTMQVSRNGQTIFAGPCNEFSPTGTLNVRIGGVPYGGRSGSRNVTYANVQIHGL